MNGFFNIDIDIFKNGLIDIDIFEKCRYINNRYISIDTSNTPKPQPPFQLRHQSWAHRKLFQKWNKFWTWAMSVFEKYSTDFMQVTIPPAHKFNSFFEPSSQQQPRTAWILYLLWRLLATWHRPKSHLLSPSMGNPTLRSIRREATLKGSGKTLTQCLLSMTTAGASEFTTTSARTTPWWPTCATSPAPSTTSTSAQSTSFPIPSLPMRSKCSPCSGGSSLPLTLRWTSSYPAT